MWHLAKKFHVYGDILFAFWIPLFAGVLAPLAIFLHLYGVFFHNSRERMSRKFELVHGMGRMGTCYPIFIAIFVATVGFNATDSLSKTVENTSDTEEIIITSNWEVNVLAKMTHGAPYFAATLVAAQLLCRLIYVIGRTERPIPSIAEIRARIRHEPSWSLRSRTAERRGRARRRGFTAIPLCVSLVVLAYGVYSPVIESEITYDQNIALVTEFQDHAIDADFSYTEEVTKDISACDIATYMDEGEGIGQDKTYSNALANLVFWGLVIGAPLLRSLLCLVMWLVPFTTTTHHIYLHFIELLSVVCAADVFAIILGFSCVEIWDFYVDSLEDGFEDNIDTYSFTPQAAYAALFLGAILEAATSSWIRWRLQCELEDGTGPARLRTFRDWLFSADDAEEPLNKESEDGHLLPEETKEYYQQD